MKSRDQQLLEEAYELIREGKLKKYKKYPIVIPPTTKEECIKAMLQSKKTSEGPWTANVNGKDVEMKPEEAINQMSLKTLRHEALHAKQEKEIPEIFKGLPKLTHSFNSSEEYKMKHYYNRPPEIMAYAYDSCMGVDAKKNDAIFDKIGGEVLELYKHYKEEYKRALKKTKLHSS